MKRALVAALVAAVACQSARAPDAPVVVEIAGSDYAFRVPDSLNAGPTVFTFKNTGKHRHEFNIFLLNPGFTIEQVVKARKEGKPHMPMIEGTVGVLFADSGATAPGSLRTNLLPGRAYGVICIFRDSASAPRHSEMGMYSVIRVGGKAAPALPAPADTIVGVDYAYTRFPREISPGVRTIAFRNEGKHRHEINIALLKEGFTLDSIIERDKKGLDVDPLFDKNGGIGVLHSQAGQSPIGNLVVDFLPGREYLVDCSFKDDEKSKPHYLLGMYNSIRVRPQ